MRNALALIAAGVLAAACGSAPRRDAGGGPYYKDDGPPASVPDHLDRVPDAVPRPEPYHRFANRPYTVFGTTYVPIAVESPYKERGIASWYGRRFQGQRTASGEPYDMFAMTAAHRTLPIPSYARVTNVANGKSVVVRINDRGPFYSKRIIDLSYAAAKKIGLDGKGSGMVEVERVFQPQPKSEQKAASAPSAPPAPEPASAEEGPTVHALAPAAPIVATPIASEALPAPGAGTNAASAEPVSANASSMPVATSATTAASSATTAPSSAAAPASAGPAPANIASTSPSPVAPRSGFWLQMGAYRTAAAAERGRAKFARELPWIAEPLAVAEVGGLWRVRAGPFANRQEAQAIAAKASKSLGFPPSIVEP